MPNELESAPILRVFCEGWALAIRALGRSARSSYRASCATLPHLAWGCKGHQTVALIAEKHLTPEARRFIDKLLTENPVEPQLKRYCGSSPRDLLADASSWLDDVRNDRKNGPWHYLDIPRDAHRGPIDPYCGVEGCGSKAIAEQLAILKDKSADPRKRAEAVPYIVHFVGDLPLLPRFSRCGRQREIRPA